MEKKRAFENADAVKWDKSRPMVLQKAVKGIRVGDQITNRNKLRMKARGRHGGTDAKRRVLF